MINVNVPAQEASPSHDDNDYMGLRFQELFYPSWGLVIVK